MTKAILTIFVLGAAPLMGCAHGGVPFSNPPAFETPQVEFDDQGRCYGRDVTPAVIETVTEQIMVQPASVATDGTVLEPAAFRTVTHQQIMRERREVAFETLCPPQLTVDFVQSLQRALKARGYYRGPIDGVMDARTGAAIRSFQRIEGHDSPLLDIRTARALGLTVLDPAQLAAEG